MEGLDQNEHDSCGTLSNGRSPSYAMPQERLSSQQILWEQLIAAKANSSALTHAHSDDSDREQASYCPSRTRLHAQVRLSGQLNVGQLKQSISQAIIENTVLLTRYLKVEGINGLRQVFYANENSLAADELAQSAEDTLDTLFAWEFNDVRADLSSMSHHATKDVLTLPETDTRPRFILFQVDNQAYRLVVSLPYLSTDYGSMTRFIDETLRYYAEAEGDYSLSVNSNAHEDEEEIDEEGIDYAQFCEWLYDLQDDESAVEGQRFWQKQLGKVHACKKIPLIDALPVEKKQASTDHAPTESRTDQHVLHAGHIQTLESISVQTGYSIDNILLGAWLVLISRHQHADDDNVISLNVLHDCRDDYEELADTMGLFLKPLPLTVNVVSTSSFNQLMTMLCEQKESMYEWQEYSPTDADTLAPFNDFAFHYSSFELKNKLSHVNVEIDNINADFAAFKLFLSCHVVEQGDAKNIKCSLSSNSEFLSTRVNASNVQLTCDVLLEQYIRLVDTILVDFDHATSQPIDTLNFSESTDGRILVASASPSASSLDEENIIEDAKNATFLAEFDAVAANYPQRIAIYDGDGEVTFEALQKQSMQLAYVLATEKKQSHKNIAICLPRNRRFIIAMLATMRIGGSFIPLEVTQPVGRISTILTDANASLLTTDVFMNNELRSIKDQHSVLLFEALSQCASETAKSYTELPSPAQLAYMIYTSGTTGTPKGVMIGHEQLFNYCHAILSNVISNSDVASSNVTSPEVANSGVRDTEQDGGVPHVDDLHHTAEQSQLRAMTAPEGENTPRHFALSSTVIADLGHTMIFPSLMSGGCLHLIPADIAISANHLRAYLQHHPIDCMKIVPSHLDALLDTCQLKKTEHEANKQDSVQGNDIEIKGLLPTSYLILGGEPCSSELIDLIQGVAPSLKVFNHYGPSETTVGVAYHELDTSNGFTQGVPLTHALPDNDIYLLDAHLQPVPIGCMGQVFVGGKQLALGYNGRADLTASSFIPNPFYNVSEPAHEGTKHTVSSRLFNTGDLAWVDALGYMHLSGRSDQQIKIRGYRIETAEIESVLRQHVQISKALVIGEQDEHTGKTTRLVAYVILEADAKTVDKASLQAFLERQLPDYMVPTGFIVIDEIPRLGNGKIDHKSLPKVETSHQEFISPQTKVQQDLLEIWVSLLTQVERETNDPENTIKIGIDHDFFNLGGHSLLAIKVMGRVCHHFNIDLPVTSIFQAPTIRELSEVIEKGDNITRYSSMVDINTVSDSEAPTLYCFHPTRGHVSCYRSLARVMQNHVSVVGLQSHELLLKQGVPETLDVLINDYVYNILERTPDGPFYLLGWCVGGQMAMSVAQKLEAMGKTVQWVGVVDYDPAVREEDVRSENDNELFADFIHHIENENIVLAEDAIADIQTTIAAMTYEEGLDYLIDYGLQGGHLVNHTGEQWQHDQLRAKFLSDKQANRLVKNKLPPKVASRLILWLTKEKLEQRVDLIERWGQYSEQRIMSSAYDADHYSIMDDASFHQSVKQNIAFDQNKNVASHKNDALETLS